MKIKALLAMAAILAAGTASAQYVSTKQGAALDYRTTMKEVEKAILSTDSIVGVSTADGKTTVRIKSCLHNENPLQDDIVMFNSATFTTPEEPTTIVQMDGEEFKAFILNTVKMAMEEAGQFNPQQFDEYANSLKAKGELSLVLNPKAAAGEKIPNSRLRVDMGMQAATMFISNAVVEGFEDITVEGGTFANCIKVKYEKRENTPSGSEKSYVTAWYAPGVGLVKEVSADKKGNVQSEQELIKIN